MVLLLMVLWVFSNTMKVKGSVLDGTIPVKYDYDGTKKKHLTLPHHTPIQPHPPT
jgi:hypothetical protein